MQAESDNCHPERERTGEAIECELRGGSSFKGAAPIQCLPDHDDNQVLLECETRLHKRKADAGGL